MTMVFDISNHYLVRLEKGVTAFYSALVGYQFVEFAFPDFGSRHFKLLCHKSIMILNFMSAVVDDFDF